MNDRILFEELKRQIVVVMQKSFPGIPPLITEWKGQEITDFQEELMRKVNAHISEKWFYTHMKGVRNALPRIDILNLLARYAGYLNWDDFRHRNIEKFDASVFPDGTSIQKRAPLIKGEYRYFIFIPVGTILIILLFMAVYRFYNVREYTFTFRDADTKETVTGIPIHVKLPGSKDNREREFVTSNGILKISTGQSLIRMVVNAPYYQKDTVIRVLKKLDTEVIVDLRADDYALMIHYISTMKEDDWKRRRTKLENLFSDDAMICQIIRSNNAMGSELFTKEEFIDRLTMPSGNLRNIEVLDTRVIDGKIKILRFRLKP